MLFAFEFSATGLRVVDEPKVGQLTLEFSGLCRVDLELGARPFGSPRRSESRVGRDFATTRSSSFSPCRLFCLSRIDKAVGSSSLLLKWLQESIELLMIFNERRRWCHSSRVKLPFVRRSANWFRVPTYMIWIFWVLDNSVE